MLKRHLLKFWDHVGNETRSCDAPFIRLVPEHAASFRPHSTDRSRRPLFSFDALRCASDWVFLFDLEDELIFPPEIAATLQRPDIAIFSRALRQVIVTGFQSESGAREETGIFRDVKRCVACGDRTLVSGISLPRHNREITTARYHHDRATELLTCFSVPVTPSSSPALSVPLEPPNHPRLPV